ncbi:hypothetical protein ACQ4PT_004830 [Festuca glaucescens]
MGKVGPESFRPPATTSCPPAWVLLDPDGHVADRDNATRAETLTSKGQPIAVSFFAAEPPAVSHFCVHCLSMNVFDFYRQPCIIYSADNLALIELSLKHDTKFFGVHREYFLYRAAGRRGRPPSLERLPGLRRHLKTLANIAIVPCGGNDSEHFVLAVLGLTSMCGQYNLHVFRSQNMRWTVKVVVMGKQAAMDPTKVIVLGGGEPRLLPANAANHVSKHHSNQFRDLVCVNGVIKLVEIENCWRRTDREVVVRDVSKVDVLYDHDLALGEDVDTEKVTYGWDRPFVREFSKVEVLYDEEHSTQGDTYDCYGWRLLTWTRTVSYDFWQRGSLVHLHDLVFQDPRHSALLPELVEKDARKSIQTCQPTMSGDGHDVVYLNSKVEQKNTNAWIVAVDTRKKIVLRLAPFWDESSVYRTSPSYIGSALSKYLNTV